MFIHILSYHWPGGRNFIVALLLLLLNVSFYKYHVRSSNKWFWEICMSCFLDVNKSEMLFLNPKHSWLAFRTTGLHWLQIYAWSVRWLCWLQHRCLNVVIVMLLSPFIALKLYRKNLLKGAGVVYFGVHIVDNWCQDS